MKNFKHEEFGSILSDKKGCERVEWRQSRLQTVAASIAIVLLIITLYSRLDFGAKFPPRAVSGLIDLTGWDFHTMDVVPLDGEWEVYWSQLIDPSEVAGTAGLSSDLLTLPKTWRGDGYGTLRLRVLLPPGTDRIALSVPDVLTAHRLWVSGRLFSQAGRVGSSRAESAPGSWPITRIVENPGSSLDLVLHVSNYHYRSGGTLEPLELGPPELEHEQEVDEQIQVAILGGLGFLGLHFLSSFGMRRHERGYLLFGLLALTLALRFAIVHDLVLPQFPAAYLWELHQKLFFAIPLLLQVVAVQLAPVLFPQEASQKATRVFTLVALVGIGFTLIIPARVYSELLFARVAIDLSVLFYGGWVAGRAAIQRRSDSALALGIVIAFGIGIGEAASRNFGLPIDLSWFTPGTWWLLLVGTAALYLRDYLRLVQRQEILLTHNSQSTIDLDTHLKELGSTRRLLSTQEERLRQQIAEFLHGRVQSKLLVAEHQLAVARDQLKPDQFETADMIDRVQGQLDSIRHNDIRLASHLLHPAVVSIGLLSALHTLAAEYEGTFTTHLEADTIVTALDDPRQNQIPQSVRLTAYRALTEALANVAAHAGASNVHIRLTLSGTGALVIEVEDDGSGFESDRMTPGLGLRTIAARLAECEGSFTFMSSPGQGTCLYLTIPLKEHDPISESLVVDSKLP